MIKGRFLVARNWHDKHDKDSLKETEFSEEEGFAFKIGKYDLFAYQQKDGDWSANELSTGFGAIGGHYESTKEEAIERAKRKIEEKGEAEMDRMLAEILQKFGRADYSTIRAEVEAYLAILPKEEG